MCIILHQFHIVLICSFINPHKVHYIFMGAHVIGLLFVLPPKMPYQNFFTFHQLFLKWFICLIFWCKIATFGYPVKGKDVQTSYLWPLVYPAEALSSQLFQIWKDIWYYIKEQHQTFTHCSVNKNMIFLCWLTTDFSMHQWHTAAQNISTRMVPSAVSRGSLHYRCELLQSR